MSLKKKVITIGLVAIAASILGGTIASAFAINKNDDTQKDKKPIGREKYIHEHINTLINKKDFMKKCLIFSNTKSNMIIEENRFRNNIDSILSNAIKKIGKFQNTIDECKIELNYRFISATNVMLDVVWYINNDNPLKYYDQFQIKIND